MREASPTANGLVKSIDMVPEILQVARVLHEERIAEATKHNFGGWTVQVPNLFDRMWERLCRAKGIRVRPEAASQPIITPIT